MAERVGRVGVKILVRYVMKRILVVLVAMVFLAMAKNVNGQSNTYVIESFESRIILNQDTSLSIEEKIGVNFLVESHGIIRVIPYSYVAKGKTLNTEVKILEVKDENGNPITYTTENFKQSKKIKIGDADKTIRGGKKYVIKYEVRDAVMDYGQGPEIYWNVAGAEWDTSIEKTSAEVISEWADIVKIDCFGGIVGTSDRDCNMSQENSQATFLANNSLGQGRDLTVVVGLNKVNKLIFPNTTERTVKTIRDNWGYLLAILPLLFMIWTWLRWGRDKRFNSANVFYKPEGKSERRVGLFERPHLPMVYSPINGLSPVEVGVMVDEKLDIEDVVAEIVEMARLGYFKIEKIEKKGFLGIKSTDYKLIRSKKGLDGLRDYQKFLVEKLFGEKKEVKISELKNKFYKHLADLRGKILDYLATTEKALTGNIDKVRGKWVGIGILIVGIAVAGLVASGTIEFNPGPLILLGVLCVPVLILAYYMPAKTAWGYSLHRQAVGLRWYLKKGKWREEIMEKNLFLEEMLPLAISLGVVDKLAKDMADIGVEPPKYFGNTTGSLFAHDLGLFSNSMRSGIVSAPSGQSRSGGWSYTGRSSWSGGSGFSGGGSSGGGFGGGGGGSW